MGYTKVVFETVEVMLIYLLAILISLHLESILSYGMIYSLMGDASGLFGIAIGVILGLILPGPRYAIYPIALVLLQNGASIAPLASLFFAQQMLTFPEGVPLELKYLGFKFTAWRFIVSFIASALGGLIVEWILSL